MSDPSAAPPEASAASELRRNPFFVLELPITASAREVEREAARLLGMLELGLAAAATYPTPLGPMARHAEDVRAAAATLRDPRKRLVAELWAGSGAGSGSFDSVLADARTSLRTNGTSSPPPADSGSGSGSGSVPDLAGWSAAMTATGWGRR